MLISADKGIQAIVWLKNIIFKYNKKIRYNRTFHGINVLGDAAT